MGIEQFFKRNKAPRANVFYAATESLRDDDGEPLRWEIRPLTTKEVDDIQNEYMKEVSIPGKPGMYRHKIDPFDYLEALLVRSVVFPDLLDAELQNSYGVMTPEELLKEIIDEPGEYDRFTKFIQKLNKLDVTMDEEAQAAKN